MSSLIDNSCNLIVLTKISLHCFIFYKDLMCSVISPILHIRKDQRDRKGLTPFPEVLQLASARIQIRMIPLQDHAFSLHTMGHHPVH